MDDPVPPPAHFRLVLVILVVTLAAAGGALFQAGRAKDAADRLLEEARSSAKAAAAAQRAAEKAEKEIADLGNDVEMLVANVDAVQRNVKELADRMEFGGGNPFTAGAGQDPGGADAPPGQPVLEYTPELRESLRKAVAAKGVQLLEDRVVIPGQVLLRQGALEFLAVFPGGKTHESIFVLTGTPGEDGAHVEGLGAALNSSLMALGLKPGTPLRILPGGRTIPARGTPVHLAVEWEEDGKTVRVRAEDLLWDREHNRSMEEGEFIYVGSYFDPEGYVPDLSGDAVAIYSVSTCVVDLDDPRAANDTVFVACGPRIPPEGTKVRMIFSPGPLEPTRTWDPRVPDRRTDPGAPVPADPGGGGGGGK